jgi:acetylornithine deacetylase/succinyl-diaminopimelate desuccinylase-like protein
MAELLLAPWADDHRARITETLFDWLRIPSISADPLHAGDVRSSAERGAALLREAGLEHVGILETGDGEGLPAVYGDWLHAGDGAPTVLVYGHHDVQPVDPLELWTSPPFEPVIVDGECRARGAIDDKGQVLYEIEAARGLLATTGALPVNLKFLIEGEEEVGSPNFERLLTEQAGLLAADVVVVSDTGMLAPDVPSATVSMRGLVGFDVSLRTASIDLHSGMWGGTVPNAARLVAELAAALHDEHHRVTVPGFYDRVETLSGAEQASIDAQPFDETDFRAQAGGVAYLEGEEGYSALERVGVRPTAEIVGIHGGYGGPGLKTIVPATAGFKVALRLVPDQRPAEIEAAFRAWIAERVPAGVEVVVTGEGGVAPAVTPIDHPAMQALADAIAAVWGDAPLWTREGGSGPEEALGRLIDAPVLFLGVGLPDDRIHAPNERMVMDQFWRGLLAAGELLDRLGRLDVGASAGAR